MVKLMLTFAIYMSLADFVITSGSFCPLKWNDPKGVGMIDHSIPCPHGTRLHGDVTLPNNATWFDWICVGYGYVPWGVVAFGVVNVLASGPLKRKRLGTRESSFVVFCAIVVCLNEFVFKRLVKESRPEESCNYSCGFPSGHSTMAVGFYTLMFLDMSSRVFPKMPLTVDEAKQETELVRKGRERAGLFRLVLLVPLSKGSVMSHFEFITSALFWAILLLPVPLSRVALGDHTPAQVFIGSLIGGIEAGLWFLLTVEGQRRWNKYLDQDHYIFRHNYPRPRFIVRSKCVRLIAEAEKKDGICPKLLEDLLDIESQMSVYQARTKEALKRIHNHFGKERSLSTTSIDANKKPLASNRGGKAFESEYSYLNFEKQDLKEFLDRLKQFHQEDNDDQEVFAS